ncbi:2-oxoacid:acceptor oxidoreductase family protein [candidate division KSB1 bacterium]|nr:2-oxoacid:acceptor oxidoreductase family protein [candidate division KSB1 bacterium]
MNAQVLKKPAAFYNKFERKGGAHQETTHYCPGCGHGILHKLIAEALDDFQISDRTILISPVGCSVFAYYYFNVGNVQAAHGRAPAVATGLKRANPESIVISYQGDGDLAAIGGNEILHAANRGENISVFFVNNAIYGMTGGQMAPTTLIGQKTTTSPRGRDIYNEGYPIRMAEIIGTLSAPVLVQRVSLHDFKHISLARRAVRKALQTQIEHKGFTFIEVLSPCPTGWKMSSVEAQKWIQSNMIPYFPLETFKDNTKDASSHYVTSREVPEDDFLEILGLSKIAEIAKPTQTYWDKFSLQEIKIAGFGGQGVLSAGVILATCGMNQGLNVSWIPSYGPEMRGGTANCSVILAKERIGSPLTPNPNVLVAMNGPSLDTFEADVEPDGLIIVNSSIIKRKVARTDVRVIYIPMTEIAAGLGLVAAANMVMLGAYLTYTRSIPVEKLIETIPLGLKKKHLIDINIQAVQAGIQFIQENYPTTPK